MESTSPTAEVERTSKSYGDAAAPAKSLLARRLSTFPKKRVGQTCPYLLPAYKDLGLGICSSTPGPASAPSGVVMGGLDTGGVGGASVNNGMDFSGGGDGKKKRERVGGNGNTSPRSATSTVKAMKVYTF